MAAVERHLPGRIGRCRNGGKYALPNSPFAPPGEAIVDRLVRAILAWAVLPPTTNLLHVHDPAQNTSIIMAFRALLVGRQVRHHLSLISLVSEWVDQTLKSEND